jgi:BNR repeat protein
MSKTVQALIWIASFYFPFMGVAGEIMTISGDHLQPRQPQLAVSADKVVHLVFGSENQIYSCLSTDEGRSFSKPILVGQLKSLSLGMRRGPRVAIAGDSVVVSAIGGEIGGGRDGDLFAWRSTDNGKSWRGPVRVNDVISSAREGLHGMAAGPDGDLFCVWLDLRNKGTQIFGSRSTDGGATWSENSLVYKSPDRSVCECCHPSVIYDDQGRLHVMWRNSLGGNRDMFWASSDDNGKTFKPAVKLGAGSWQLDACPMDGGAMAVARDGKLAAAWRRDKEVFLTASKSSEERKLGDGLQPWAAANKRGIYAVWITDRPGELYLAGPEGNQPTKLASRARDPVIASTQQASLVVAWEADEDGKPVVKLETISLGVE